MAEVKHEDWDFFCACGRGYLARVGPLPDLGAQEYFCRSCGADLSNENRRAAQKQRTLKGDGKRDDAS